MINFFPFHSRRQGAKSTPKTPVDGQAGGGDSVLAYAVGETGDNVVKWDFDDNTAQGWEVSNWGIT